MHSIWEENAWKIVGIPCTVNDNSLEEKVIQVFKKVGCNIDSSNVEKCHHITKRNDSCSLTADLKNIFFRNYLKILDYHDGLVLSYQISMSFAEKMEDFEAKLTDNFVENLKEDINGNIIAEVKEKESVDSINLNFTHKPSCKATTSKIEAMNNWKKSWKNQSSKTWQKM